MIRNQPNLLTLFGHSLPVLVGLGFLFFAPLVTLAATMSLTPSSGVYTTGGTFTASVVLNTAGKPINAAEGTIRFKPGELSVVGVSRGSIFNLWTVEPTFSNTDGTITFGGGSPSGYTGSAGVIMNITFRATNAGAPRVTFGSGSVLAADGLGTNVLTDMNGGTYTIAARAAEPEPEIIQYVPPANTPNAPRIESSTHPDPTAWYPANTAKLSWTVPTGVTAIRTLLDNSPNTIPTKLYSTPITEIALDELPEGESYFHLQFQNADGWGAVRHYRLGVDTKNPSDFTISLPDGADLSNPIQTLQLEVVDDTSPVNRYTVQIDSGEPYEYIDDAAAGAIVLPTLSPGYHAVIIEAFDAAGNSIVGTFSFTILAFDRPEFTNYPTQLNAGVIPVITGVTRQNAEVTVTVAKQDRSEPNTYQVQSDESGTFTFIPDAAFGLGVYELTAVAVDEYGATSEPSLPIKIAVQQPGYLTIGTFIVSVLSVVIPLIALVVLLLVGVWYVIYRIRRLRGRVRAESKEALDILRQEFVHLQTVLSEQSSTLQDSRKTKRLTAAETALIDQVANALSESEKRVEKEIADVSALVNNK